VIAQVDESTLGRVPVAAAPVTGRLAAGGRRIDHIDGLRAVAVLAVIVHHVVAYRGFTTGIGPHIAHEGAHGVDLFFVLSGFCLAYPTLAKLRDGRAAMFDIVGFGARRLVRILPPYYIATALMVLALIVVPALLRPGRPVAWTALDVVQAMLFLDGNVRLLNGAFWTLMVEFRWYFAFPVLLLVWIKSPRAFFALAGIALILYTLTRARDLDLGTLPGFMLGIVAAELSLLPYGTNRWADLARRWALPLAVLCAVVGIASEPYSMIPGGAYSANLRFPYQPTILGWQLAMFFFVVAGGELVAMRSVLSHRAFVATGVASYGIYLAHQPVIELIEDHLRGPAGAWAALLIAPLAGFVFWAVAERPFTTGSLRAPLVRRVTALLDPAFRWLAVPRSVAMGARHGAPIEEAIAPREREASAAALV
jgi:peptidoglycan/LPS O-acetylase OafA/YrhL